MQDRKPLLVADMMRDNRGNAFSLLRLSAAMLVFVSHENLVAGKAMTVPGYFGVYVFFVLSGFLIARSWDRRMGTAQYFRNRGLRILPGLWAVVLITTFVVGPIATNLPLSKYFSDPTTWRYLLNLVFEHERILPGVFYGNPNHLVNVPLWTLAHEALFYVSFALLGLMFREHLRYVVLALYLIVLMQNDTSLLHGQSNTDRPSNLLIYFLGGSLVWFFREHIVVNRWLLLLALAALISQVTLKLDSLLWSLSLPYVVLWCGLRQPSAVFSHFRSNDYSYGLYVWGFICQQCVVAATGITSTWPHAVLAFTATALCACCSWHLLEKHALKLKAPSIDGQGRHPPASRHQETPGEARIASSTGRDEGLNPEAVSVTPAASK